MKARAATLGSVGTAIIVAGLAMLLGSGASTLLFIFGVLAVVVGVIIFGGALVLHVRAAKQANRNEASVL